VQNTDETACYQWAFHQTRVDPLNSKKVEVVQVEQGLDGSAVKGAAVVLPVELELGQNWHTVEEVIIMESIRMQHNFLC
jgi:hypothetical protein